MGGWGAHLPQTHVSLRAPASGPLLLLEGGVHRQPGPDPGAAAGARQAVWLRGIQDPLEGEGRWT